MPPPKRRSREIDWLRAYAILFVLAEHATLAMPYATGWSDVVHVWFEGRTGVDLFFVISGFVISASFIDGFDRALAAGNALRHSMAFYRKRLVRLGPAAAFWAIALLAASILFVDTQAFPPPAQMLRKALAALFYVYNFSEATEPTTIGYFYSLSTEMQFYLAFPILLAIVGSPRRRLALLAFVFGLGALGCPGLDSRAVFRFSGILAGIALYLLTCLPRADGVASREPPPRAAPLVAGCFTLSLLIALAICTLPAYGAFSTHVAAGVGFALVWAARGDRGRICAFGMPRVLDWIGSRSYSLYLCHTPAMLVMRSVLFTYKSGDGGLVAAPLISPALVLMLCLVAVLFATEATYRILEAPFQRHLVVRASAVAPDQSLGFAG